MPGRIKELMLKEYLGKLKDAQSLFLVQYPGIKADDNNQLRKKLNDSGNSLLHVKNTLFQKALKEIDLSDLTDAVEGFCGIVFGDDVISAVKTVDEFSKDFKNLKVSGGYFEGQILSAEEMKALSSIPPREVLLAQVMGAIQGPVAGVPSLLNSLLSKLVMTVKEIEKTK